MSIAKTWMVAMVLMLMFVERAAALSVEFANIEDPTLTPIGSLFLTEGRHFELSLLATLDETEFSVRAFDIRISVEQPNPSRGSDPSITCKNFIDPISGVDTLAPISNPNANTI